MYSVARIGVVVIRYVLLRSEGWFAAVCKTGLTMKN